MDPRIRQYLPWVGYPLFYLFCLVAFAYLSAPYERMKHALTAGFNSGDSQLRMEIEDLSWSWRFPGVAASGVRLVGAQKKPAAPADDKAPPATEYSIDDMYVRVSVFPMLIGSIHLGFGMDAFGGEISGTAKTSDDEKTVYLELEELDPGQVPYLADIVGLPMTGLLNGELELVLPEGKYSEAEGEVLLDVEDLGVGDGKAKIRGTIALPRLEAGTVTLRATAEEGKLKVDELSAEGADLELESEGKIRLSDRVEASLVDVNLRFKFSDAYKNKNDMTRGLFGEPGSKVPGLFDLDPQIKRAKRPDGFYAWRLSGPLSKINFQPASAPTAAKQRGARPTRTATNPRTSVRKPRQPPNRALRTPPTARPAPPAAPPAPTLPPAASQPDPDDVLEEDDDELEEEELDEEDLEDEE